MFPRPAENTKEIDSAVQPGCKLPKIQCGLRIVQPVDIKSQKLVYNTNCRMKHDLEDHCRKSWMRWPLEAHRKY